jgi:hypothetical protein
MPGHNLPHFFKKLLVGCFLQRLTFKLSKSTIQAILGQSVRFAIYLDCECDGEITRDYKEIMIDGEDYLAWGTDDAYVIELVKTRLASIL